MMMDGGKVEARGVVPAGEHHFAINGKLKPIFQE